MAAQDSAYQFTFGPGCEAHARIPVQEILDAMVRIRFAQSDIIAYLPQAVDLRF